MKTIVMASTQMQLLNCIELCKHKGIRSATLIVFCYSETRRQQMKEFLDIPEIRENFGKLIWFTAPRNKLLHVLFHLWFRIFLWLHFKTSTYTTCIVGNGFPVQNRLLMYHAQNSNADIFVTDDGLASVTSYNLRCVEIEKGVAANSITSGSDRLAYISSRVINYIPRKLNYYTVYDFPANKIDTTIYNEYIFLKSNYHIFNSNILNASPDIVILGQPLVQKNVISKESFNYYIRNVIKENPTSKIAYCMHPEENLDEDIFDDEVKNSIVVLKDKFPFEILAPAAKLVSVYSFYSSALINLKCMNLPFFVYAIYIKEIDHNDALLYSRIKDCYSYFEKEGLTIRRY